MAKTLPPHCKRVFVCIFRLLRFSKPPYHSDRVAEEDPCIPKCIFAFALHVAFPSAPSCRIFHFSATTCFANMGGQSFVLCMLLLYSDAGDALVTQQSPSAYCTLAFPTSYASGSLGQIGNRALCNAIHGIFDDAPRNPYRASIGALAAAGAGECRKDCAEALPGSNSGSVQNHFSRTRFAFSFEGGEASHLTRRRPW